jgi:hypothetical protein
MGEDRHCRFTVETGTSRAAGVCFGRTGFGVAETEPVDVLARLEINHWNGSVTPQLQVREVYPVRSGEAAGSQGAPAIEGCDVEEWWERFESEMSRPVEEPMPGSGGDSGWTAGGRELTEDAAPPGVLAAELISSGQSLAMFTSDATRRWHDFGGERGLARFRPEGSGADASALDGSGAAAVLIWPGSPEAVVAQSAAGHGSGIAVIDYECLSGRPGLVSPFTNLLQLEPPGGPAEAALSAAGEGPLIRSTDPGGVEFAEAASARRNELTSELRLLYGTLREAAEDGVPAGGERLRAVLAGEPGTPRAPELAARLLRVLVEVDGARSDGHGDARVAGVVSSGKIDLARSSTFTACVRAHKERVRYLRQSNRQIS